MSGSQKISQLKGLSSEVILLSAIDAVSTTAVAEMTKAVHAVLPNAVVLVGLWNLPNTGSAELMREIQNSSVRAMYTNLKEAIEGIASQLGTSIDTDSSLTERGSATAA